MASPARPHIRVRDRPSRLDSCRSTSSGEWPTAWIGSPPDPAKAPAGPRAQPAARGLPGEGARRGRAWPPPCPAPRLVQAAFGTQQAVVGLGHGHGIDGMTAGDPRAPTGNGRPRSGWRPPAPAPGIHDLAIERRGGTGVGCRGPCRAGGGCHTRLAVLRQQYSLAAGNTLPKGRKTGQAMRGGCPEGWRWPLVQLPCPWRPPCSAGLNRPP